MTPESRQALVAWQLQVERRDGPRYAEAIRGARKMRYVGFTRIDPQSYGPHATGYERDYGLPLPHTGVPWAIR